MLDEGDIGLNEAWRINTTKEMMFRKKQELEQKRNE